MKTPREDPVVKKAPREPKTKLNRRARCAESGEFVTTGYAEANPTTTTTESVRPRTQSFSGVTLGDTSQFGIPGVSHAGGEDGR